MTSHHNSPSPIRTTVMRRVQTIHALRPLLSSSTAALGLFTVSLYLLGREVWVARVFQNMPSTTNILAVTHFFLSAFLSTRTIVQLVILLSTAAFVWLLCDIARSLSISLRYV